jgi:hypothetical protein
MVQGALDRPTVDVQPIASMAGSPGTTAAQTRFDPGPADTNDQGFYPNFGTRPGLG